MSQEPNLAETQTNAVTLSKSLEVSIIISAYALTPASQGVGQEPNLAEINKEVTLFKSSEVSEIVSA